MDGTVFRQILGGVVSQIPGSKGAIFADWDGEIIDHASSLDDSEMAYWGAHWGIIFKLATTRFRSLGFGRPALMTLSFDQEQVILCSVEDDYFIALTVPPNSYIGQATRRLLRARQAIMEQL